MCSALDSPEEAAVAGEGEGTDPAEIDISKPNNFKWNDCLESAERNWNWGGGGGDEP